MRAMILGLMHMTATVCSEWTDIQNEYADDLQQFLSRSRSFMERAQSLDAELENWAETRSPEWKTFTTDMADVAIPTWLTKLYQAPGAPTSILSAKSFNVAHRWNYWRAMRLCLSYNMLAAIDLQLSVAAQTTTTTQIEDLITTQTLLELRILGLIDNLCDAFYANLTMELTEKPEANTIDEVCGLRGYTMLWPLYRAGMCFRRKNLKTMDISNRSEWIRAALKFLAEDLCIAKAQAFLNNVDGLYGEIYL
jgi:hypothetical protein